MDYQLNLITPCLYSPEGNSNCKDDLVEQFAEYVKNRAYNKYKILCKYDKIPGLAFITNFEDFENRFLIHSEYACIIASSYSQKALNRFVPRLLVFLTSKPIWQNRFFFVFLGQVKVISNLFTNDPIQFSEDNWEKKDEESWRILLNLIKDDCYACNLETDSNILEWKCEEIAVYHLRQISAYLTTVLFHNVRSISHHQNWMAGSWKPQLEEHLSDALSPYDQPSVDEPDPDKLNENHKELNFKPQVEIIDIETRSAIDSKDYEKSLFSLESEINQKREGNSNFHLDVETKDDSDDNSECSSEQTYICQPSLIDLSIPFIITDDENFAKADDEIDYNKKDGKANISLITSQPNLIQQGQENIVHNSTNSFEIQSTNDMPNSKVVNEHSQSKNTLKKFNTEKDNSQFKSGKQRELQERIYETPSEIQVQYEVEKLVLKIPEKIDSQISTDNVDNIDHVLKEIESQKDSEKKLLREMKKSDFPHYHQSSHLSDQRERINDTLEIINKNILISNDKNVSPESSFNKNEEVKGQFEKDKLVYGDKEDNSLQLINTDKGVKDGKKVSGRKIDRESEFNRSIISHSSNNKGFCVFEEQNAEEFALTENKTRSAEFISDEIMSKNRYRQNNNDNNLSEIEMLEPHQSNITLKYISKNNGEVEKVNTSLEKFEKKNNSNVTLLVNDNEQANNHNNNNNNNNNNSSLSKAELVQLNQLDITLKCVELNDNNFEKNNVCLEKAGKDLENYKQLDYFKTNVDNIQKITVQDISNNKNNTALADKMSSNVGTGLKKDISSKNCAEFCKEEKEILDYIKSHKKVELADASNKNYSTKTEKLKKTHEEYQERVDIVSDPYKKFQDTKSINADFKSKFKQVIYPEDVHNKLKSDNIGNLGVTNRNRVLSVKSSDVESSSVKEEETLSPGVIPEGDRQINEDDQKIVTSSRTTGGKFFFGISSLLAKMRPLSYYFWPAPSVNSQLSINENASTSPRSWVYETLQSPWCVLLLFASGTLISPLWISLTGVKVITHDIPMIMIEPSPPILNIESIYRNNQYMLVKRSPLAKLIDFKIIAPHD